MSNTLMHSLITELDALFEPIALAAEDSGWLARLVQALGIEDDANVEPLLNVLTAVLDARHELSSFDADSLAFFDDIASLLDCAGKLFSALHSIDTATTSTPALRGIGGDFVQLLVTSYFIRRHPLVFRVAALFSVVEWSEATDPITPVVVDDRMVRIPRAISRIHPDRLYQLLRDPVAVLKAEYANALESVADSDAMSEKLFPRLAAILSGLNIPWIYGLSGANHPLLGDAAALVDHSLTIYIDEKISGATANVGLTLAFSSADRGDLGLVVSPFGALNLSRQVGNWSIEVNLAAEVEAVAYGRHGITLVTSGSRVDASGLLSAILPMPETGPGLVLGSTSGTRLEFGSAEFRAATLLSETKPSMSLSADVTKSVLVISPGDGDGFLTEILPSEGLRAEFDLGLAWSSDKGLTLRGSAGLEAVIPVGLSVAGVRLDTVNLGLRAKDDRVNAEVSAGIAASIGPVKAVLDRVGIESTLSFPETGGNLGVANLELGFKPPSGVGLSVDAQGVLTGGGMLFHDPARQIYAGAMQLSLHDELTLAAYGLIATKLPDGRPGYSLLIFVTADGFNPIPLGFGFMLQSIGGMVGIHRTFDHEVLKTGLKTDSLRTLLLPQDPIANAPALIQSLAAAFPAKRGSYLLGLLARITWFTPTLVQMDLALIQELGARERLLVLGRVSALLPSADNDLIRLNLDAVGVLDFDAGTVEADAVLVDSRLVHRFPITGSGALRARWPGVGRTAEGTALTGSHFVLAVGGLNPRFHAPAAFPALERVTLALCSGDNPRLICDAYFAITPNTVQFGAHASLYARALNVSVNGDLAFDALVTVVPPHFAVDFHAAVQLKYKSHNLFKVALDGTLEGPLPLRIAARAKFEILWFSIAVRFEFTLAGFLVGRGGLVSVSLEAELKKTLRDPANWSTRRAPGIAHGVALRSLPQNAGLVLEPLGQLMVQQQLVPLNTQRDIDTYGGAEVTGARRFSLAGGLASAQPAQASTQPVQGAFAPARYFTMSDDEKLAAPSFEQKDAGLVLGDAAVSFGPETKLSLGYNTITVPPLPAPGTAASTLAVAAEAAPPVYEMPWSVLQAQCSSGAAAQAPVRSVGRARFRNTAATPVALLKAPVWRVVPASGAKALLSAAPAPGTWSDCQVALADLNRGGARWRMVPEYELAV